MRTIITIAFAVGLVLTAGVVGFWATSLPAGSSLKPGPVDPHQITLRAKDLPAQQVDSFY
jgi:hypothetical protein